MESTDSKKNTHEIDILAMALGVLKEWRTLFKFCVVFGIFGIGIALITKKSYTVSVILAPETSSGSAKLGELSGLASTLGANISSLGNLGSSEDAITPLIYPNLFASLDFLLPLCDIPVQERGADTVITYEKHVLGKRLEKYANGDPVNAKGFFKDNNSQSTVDSKYYLTSKEKDMFRSLSKSIGCIGDKKTDIVTITVTDHDPMVAAILADTIKSRLQQYIISYRTTKVRKDLEYYLMLLETAQNEYEEARNAYSEYTESHKGVVQTSFKLTKDYLEDEMSQKYTLLTQVQMQVHSARARVQEATPAFAVIQNPYIPMKASTMSRSQMVVLAGFIGFLVGALWIVLGRNLYARIRKGE